MNIKKERTDKVITKDKNIEIDTNIHQIMDKQSAIREYNAIQMQLQRVQQMQQNILTQISQKQVELSKLRIQKKELEKWKKIEKGLRISSEIDKMKIQLENANADEKNLTNLYTEFKRELDGKSK